MIIRRPANYPIALSEQLEQITENNLQMDRMLSNGAWIADDERLLDLCEKFNGVDDLGKVVPGYSRNSVRLLTRDEIVRALAYGHELRIDDQDWYSKCRSGSSYRIRKDFAQKSTKAVVMVKCDCGHTVPKGSVMSASLERSCPDCYDRMSD